MIEKLLPKKQPFRKPLLPRPQRGLYQLQPTFQSILSVMFADCTGHHPRSQLCYQQSAAWWGQSRGTVENKAKNNYFQIKILNWRGKEGGEARQGRAGFIYLHQWIKDKRREKKAFWRSWEYGRTVFISTNVVKTRMMMQSKCLSDKPKGNLFTRLGWAGL